MAKNASTFGKGMLNELRAFQCVDGSASFNAENLIATVIHAATGFFVGGLIGKLTKAPSLKQLIGEK